MLRRHVRAGRSFWLITRGFTPASSNKPALPHPYHVRPRGQVAAARIDSTAGTGSDRDTSTQAAAKHDQPLRCSF